MTFAEKMRKKTDESIEKNVEFSKEFYETKVKSAIDLAATLGYEEISLFGDLAIGEVPERVIANVIFDCAKADGFAVNRIFGKISW